MKKKTAAKKNQHVIPLGNGWAVKGDGSVKFSIITDRKSEAVAFAKGVAASHNAEVIIYSKDGSVKEPGDHAKKAVAAPKS